MERSLQVLAAAVFIVASITGALQEPMAVAVIQVNLASLLCFGLILSIAVARLPNRGWRKPVRAATGWGTILLLVGLVGVLVGDYGMAVIGR